MALTESWLCNDTPDTLLQVEGFSCVQVDRDASSGKTRGGGIYVYVKDSWCRQFSIRETLCDSDVEILLVLCLLVLHLSMCPFSYQENLATLSVQLMYHRVEMPLEQPAASENVRTTNLNALWGRLCLFFEILTIVVLNNLYLDSNSMLESKKFWTNVLGT